MRTTGQFEPFHSLILPYSSLGSRQLPGFHTAINKDMTAVFAQASFEVSAKRQAGFITYHDYPAIVSVNVLDLN